MKERYYDCSNLIRPDVLSVDLPNVKNCQNPAEYALIQQNLMFMESQRLCGYDTEGYNWSIPGGIYPTENCL